MPSLAELGSLLLLPSCPSCVRRGVANAPADTCELRFYLAYGKTLAKVGLRAAAFFVSVDFPAKYAQASWPSPEHYWTAGRARKLAPGPIGPSAAK